jgi:aspergillopepsin I
MPLIASIAALAGLSSLAFASPIDKVEKRVPASFRINQVEAGSSRKVGAVALQKAYHKYGKTAPQHVADAAAAQTGEVVANPEQYDSEYLCPVSVGGTTMHLDFDTGSADLYVLDSQRHD